MAADGLTNRDIAQALFVTAKTVENQLGAVYRKLGVHDRDQLAVSLAAALSAGSLATSKPDPVLPSV
jgi:DNA-binding NarL/FixJ family response regulator